MEFRSTNDQRVHFHGDVVSNVSSAAPFGSSHGCHLTGGSTGALFTAAGDEANVTANFAGKGTGPTRLGNSSSPVTFGSTLIVLSTGSVLQVGSTAPWGGDIRQVSSFATPNFSTTNAMVMETTHVITGANSSHLVIGNGANLSTDCVLVGVYAASTAGDVHCRFAKVSTLTVAAATATMRFLVTRF